jgi:hypothetical protein
MVENKNTFFQLNIELKQDHNNLSTQVKDEIQAAIDILYGLVRVEDTEYTFQKNKRLTFLFKCETRKRSGQIINILRKGGLNNHQYVLDVRLEPIINRRDFEQAVMKCRYEKWTTLSEPDKLDQYSGKDIEVLNDPKNYHEWQIQLFHFLFKNGDPWQEPIKANSRSIVNIVDGTGACGKSVICKWLAVNRGDTVSCVTYGNPQQLRGVIVKSPTKQIYLIDLPKAIQDSSNFNEANLLTIAEELANGNLQNMLYASGTSKLMEPPSVVIFSNYHLNYSKLSADRWIGLKMNRTKKNDRIWLDYFDTNTIDVTKENKKLVLEAKEFNKRNNQSQENEKLIKDILRKAKLSIKK